MDHLTHPLLVSQPPFQVWRWGIISLPIAFIIRLYAPRLGRKHQPSLLDFFVQHGQSVKIGFRMAETACTSIRMRRGLHRWIGSGSTFGHRLCARLAYGRLMITNARLLHLLHLGHKKTKLPGSRCLTVSRLLFLATLLAIPSLCIILCAPTPPAKSGFSYDKTGCTPIENRIRPYVAALPGVPSGTCHTLHESYSAIARCNHQALLYDHHILHHRTHPNKPLPHALAILSPPMPFTRGIKASWSQHHLCCRLCPLKKHMTPRKLRATSAPAARQM